MGVQPESRETDRFKLAVLPSVARLLNALEREPVTNEVLRGLLQINDRGHVRTHYIVPALEAGLIERTIPDKPNSRLQQYRITAAGLAALERWKKPG